jgi:hypothetical protein
MELKLHVFLTSTLDGTKWLPSLQQLQSRGKSPRYPLESSLVAYGVGLDVMGKNSALARNRTTIVHYVATHIAEQPLLSITIRRRRSSSYHLQRRSIHVHRVSPANTFKNGEQKSSVLISCFSGTPYTGTQKNRSDKMLR